MLRWIEGLPPWIKFAFIIGGALLSAFSERLPESIQDFGLYVGIALIAVGCIGLALHFCKQKRGGAAMAPVDLIVVGLVGAGVSLALITTGFVWQQNRATTLISASSSSPLIWRKLTETERGALLANLKRMPIGTIWVTCESSDCYELAEDFVAVFRAVNWPQPWHGKSAGMEGMDPGISIGPNTEWSQSLKEAIESATYVQLQVSDTIGPFSDPTITLLAIGPKSLHGTR